MAIIGANSDFCTLFSRNFLRMPGSTVSASASTTGYYADSAVDGDRSTAWWSSSATVSDYLTFDCGATISQAATHFWLNGNVSDFTLYASSDGSTWGTAILDVTGQAAASINAISAGVSNRYFKLVCSRAITAGEKRKVYSAGVYAYQYAFSALYNPAHSVGSAEAGQPRTTWNGATWRPIVREINAISLPLERIPVADRNTLLAFWRSWRSGCAIAPEPYSKPSEVFDVVAGEFNLGYFSKLRTLGYMGTLSFNGY